MDPHYHTGIPIWERGLIYPHMEMINNHFHMGIENFWRSPFPYGEHRTETGIDASPFPYRDCPLPNGDSTEMDLRYHTGIPIWERGLTHPHKEMVHHHFHMGIEKFWLPVSI